MQNDYESLYDRVLSSSSVKFCHLNVEQKKFLAKHRKNISTMFGEKENVFEAKSNWYDILKGLFREGFINE